jgi:tetratricopeptide (TPR) repeat protein
MLFVLMFVFVYAAPPATAQQEDERRRAFRLFNERKFDDAVPLLEKLAEQNPDDAQVIGGLGFAVLMRSMPLKDEARRKQERVRARALLVRARELGNQDQMVELAIKSITPDGGEPAGASFSKNREADELMREGERAFSRREYNAALKAYTRALQLDPQLYEAALFAGDVFFNQEKWDEAGAWFARATGMNPDRETAYRYWGNALMRQGKLAEARDKYIEAVIADPYNSYVWNNGLFRWANATKTRLGHPKIEPASSISQTGKEQLTITIDPKSLEESGDGRAAWMMYGIARAAWAVKPHENFRKAYPAETEYRHSLREEADALRMVAESVRGQQKEGKIKQLAPDLAQLLKLDAEGLLEAYVLLARADEGIARDYAAYRKANRDKLQRYLSEYVTSGKY